MKSQASPPEFIFKERVLTSHYLLEVSGWWRYIFPHRSCEFLSFLLSFCFSVGGLMCPLFIAGFNSLLVDNLNLFFPSLCLSFKSQTCPESEDCRCTKRLWESCRMGRVTVRAALPVPAFIPCTANTCSGYKWLHEEFISCAVSGFCIPLLTFWSAQGYHSCFVLCCPSPSCALFLSLLQQSHLGIHKTPIKFSLPQLLQEQKNVSFTSQTFWCGGNRLYVKKMNSE